VAGMCQAEDVRDFNADTPGKTYSPYTVSQGYFQIESDSFHIIAQTGMQTIEVFDPVIKYGLTDTIDISLQTNGFFDIRSKTGGKTTHVFGYGDIVPTLKWNLIGDNWEIFAASLQLGVKIPTASPGVGNGAMEYYAILPTQLGLPAGFTLQIQEEIDLLRNQADNGRHFNYAEVVSLSRSFAKVTVSGDVFAQSGTDARSPPNYTVDLGISYALSPVAVLSFGTYFGLNSYTPHIEAYTGFAFRF
jgi:hypothetical protein